MWRASSQWRLDGYTSFGETSTGNPYANELFLLGLPLMARLHWEPWILSCLLACPQRVIFFLVATASHQLVVPWQQSLQRTTKDMVQLVFYNRTFLYISKERREDTILVCHGWLHYRKWRHSSNSTDPQGDVIVTSWQNKTKHSSGLEETICTMVT